MATNGNNFYIKNTSDLFVCEQCDFSCSKKGDWNRHINTRKHKNQHLSTNFTSKLHQPFICSQCNKEFKDRSGLWRHSQKKCSPNVFESASQNNPVFNETIDNKDLILTLLKQNNSLQNQVVELLKNGIHNTTNTTHTNSHNKTFNLQIFLNETCKNAMNITDFVNSLQLQLGDLEKMGDVGYVNGMSNIIIKSLKDMDITERPVHCTDKKRETLYVKEDGSWDKESNNKPRIRKAIKQIARKNALLIKEYKEKHHDCMQSDSPYADTYNKLIIEAMGGKDYDEECQESKIIKNITQEVSVDK